jgi:RNA polymerase sigma factor (sigma-70 family)
MLDNAQLLRDYAKDRSDQAFGELVRRQMGLVYSTALRVVGGDAHLAEDVTQTVFVDLARNARSLCRCAALSGWLYRHTCYTASKVVRSERRRLAREQQAVAMNAQSDRSDAESVWQQIVPILDEAMNRLGTRDRDAIVLRFFEECELRVVGAALGVSEDGAQKRVARALEKLRGHFARRGITLSTAALATLLTSQALSTAPPALAASVTGSALAAAGGTSLGLALFNLMTTTQAKVMIGTAVLLAGVGGPVVFQYRTNVKLREENAALLQKTVEAADLREQLAGLRALAVDAAELKRLRAEHEDLMRLRGQVGELTRELANYKKAASPRRNDAVAGANESGVTLTTDALQDAGAATPEAAIQTMLWAAKNKDGGRFAELLDQEGLRNRFFVELRRAAPNISVTEAEHIAADALEKMKAQLAAGEFLISSRNPDDIAYWRVSESAQSESIPGVVLVKLISVLRDGTSRTEGLKLTQSADRWYITSSEESTVIQVTPTVEGQPQP